MEMSLTLLKELALSTVVSMALVGGVYFILDGQNDDIREGLGELSGRMAVVETKLDGVDSRLGRMDGRLEQMDGRLDQMDGRLDQMDGRLERMDGRLDGIETQLHGIRNLLTEK